MQHAEGELRLQPAASGIIRTVLLIIDCFFSIIFPDKRGSPVTAQAALSVLCFMEKRAML